MAFGSSVQATLTILCLTQFNNIIVGTDTSAMTTAASASSTPIPSSSSSDTETNYDVSHPSTSLFHLPKEIRKRICFHALRPDCALSHGDKRCVKHHIHQSKTTSRQVAGALLRTCKAIFAEASSYHLRPSGTNYKPFSEQRAHLERKGRNPAGESPVSVSTTNPALFNDDASAAAANGLDGEEEEDRTDIRFFRYWSPPRAFRRRHGRKEYFGKKFCQAAAANASVPLFLEEDFKLEPDVDYVRVWECCHCKRPYMSQEELERHRREFGGWCPKWKRGERMFGEWVEMNKGKEKSLERLMGLSYYGW